MSFADKRFGNLTILKETAPDIFLCKCDCGTRVEFFRSQLANDVKRHCGCLSSKQGDPVHGGHTRTYKTRSGKQRMRTSAEFNSWKNMKERCTVKSRLEYENYGGRGIQICERWKLPKGEGFRNFLADMGPRPAGMTLDRINPQGHYEPTNCRWATAETQTQNQRRYLYPDGDMPTVEDFASMEKRLEEELHPY